MWLTLSGSYWQLIPFRVICCVLMHSFGRLSWKHLVLPHACVSPRVLPSNWSSVQPDLLSALGRSLYHGLTVMTLIMFRLSACVCVGGG